MKYFIIIKDKSTRVPDKNFRILGDKPLYRWLVDKLPSNETFINTDSDRVEGDFNIIKRSEKHIRWENEQPTSPVLDMINEFLDNHVEDENEIIVTPHVTSPFLTKETILKATEKLGEYDSIMSCTSHKEFAYLKRNNGVIPINFHPKAVKRTQDLDPIIFQNGAFFIFTKKTFKEHNNRVGSNPYFYELDIPESIEIDYEEDYKLASMICEGV